MAVLGRCCILLEPETLGLHLTPYTPYEYPRSRRACPNMPSQPLTTPPRLPLPALPRLLARLREAPPSKADAVAD